MTAENVSNENKKAGLYAWCVLAMMVLLYLVNVADRYVASGLLEDIKETYQVSDTFMGFLIGPAFALFYTSLAIPIAMLADRYNRVRIIVSGAIIWSGFAVFSGLADDPWTFAIARIGVGVGEAAFLAPAFSILADYFPTKKRALAFAVLNFGVYFGQITGQVGGAQIAEYMGNWRAAFIILGAPGILLALLTLIIVREPKRGRMDLHHDQTNNDNELSYIKTVGLLWQSRCFRYLTLGTAFGGFASYGFGLWAPTLFARMFELDLVTANKSYGVPALFAGLAGAVLLGAVCDKVASKNPQWPFRLSAVGLIGFAITMIWLCFVDDLDFATLLVFPAGLLAGGWVIALQAALQDLIPTKIRARTTAIWSFALTFAGLAMGTWFVGLVVDLLDSQFGDQAIRYAMAITLLATFPAAISLLMAAKFVKEDTDYFARL